jgi:uncharacterized protein (DUF302 family)
MQTPPAIRTVSVERFGLVSARPFNDVLASLEAAIGHPEIAAFWKQVGLARTFAELEKVVAGAVGSSGLMEFTRFDLGRILRMESGDPNSPRILRLVIGNPLVMKEMAKHVSDTGSYAPVTVLVDERADGVHLSYDRMASLLAPYGSAEALKVAGELDAKIEGLLTKAVEG